MLIPVLLGLYYSNRNMEVLLMNNDMARGYLGFFFGVLIAGLSEKIKGKAVRKLNVISVVMIILFLVQEGNDRGMGIVAGASSDSYYSKAKGRSLEERLKRWTAISAILFAIVSIVLYLAINRGW